VTGPDDTPADIPGDLPPIDPELAAWLASDTPGPMPADVWDRIQASLAAEPALIPAGSNVVDLGAERTRRRGRRVLPLLAGAAGLAVVGAVVLPSMQTAGPAPVADGASTAQPIVAGAAPEAEASTEPLPADSAKASNDAANSTAGGAAATVAEAPMPRAMVATGTDYTADALPAQVVTLLADAGMADGASVATAMTASPSPTSMPGVGLAASPEALADCLERLGLPAGSVPLVLDTATIDGREGSVIVTAGQMDGEGIPTSLHVVAVGQECSEADVAGARHWDLPLR
jgi:hypothetical protein